jgi:multiple sugar transport system substrate-binding protein
MSSALRRLALATILAVALTACGNSYNEPDDSEGGGEATGTSTPAKAAELTVMIGSSGEAETKAVQAAGQRFTDKTGTKVRVIPAQDLVQQLQQGFAGGNPPDAFYVSPDRFKLYVEGNSLYPYADQLDDADDFYPSLRKAFTADGKFYCAPKDAGNVALVIDTDAWTEAGLTEADHPKTWDQLATVAQKLTKGKRAGLSFSRDYNVIGNFMLAGGGFYVNDDETEVTANTPENVATLTYLKQNLDKGVFKFPQDIEATWGGEALGSGKSAMTIEGAWVVGALQNDFPDRKWKAVPMPAGPAGTDTTVFTNCWGIAQDSKFKDTAVELVKHLVSPAEQQAATEAFGPTPSRQSLADWYATKYPDKAPFAAGIANSRAQISLPGFQSVLADFNTQLELLAAGKVTPQQALDTMQKNGAAALKAK